VPHAAPDGSVPASPRLARAGGNTAAPDDEQEVREGTLDDKMVEIEVADAEATIEIMGPPGMERDGRAVARDVLNIGGQAPSCAR
jgi:ATP-dependent HslUV protease ATP-binding subunit HslU